MTALQVAAGSGIVAVLTMVGTWGRADDPRPWTRTRPGDPYRHPVMETKASPGRAVGVARSFAWVVVAVSVLRALILLVQILAGERVASAGTVNCATFPCDPVRLSAESVSCDVLSASLHGLYLVATAAAIGAFARWARDASGDMNQARRAAPLVAGIALAVVALGVAPLGQDYVASLGVAHAAVVLIGVVLVAIARRGARDGGGATAGAARQAPG